jgi:hypothetical protein
LVKIFSHPDLTIHRSIKSPCRVDKMFIVIYRTKILKSLLKYAFTLWSYERLLKVFFYSIQFFLIYTHPNKSLKKIPNILKNLKKFKKRCYMVQNSGTLSRKIRQVEYNIWPDIVLCQTGPRPQIIYF